MIKRLRKLANKLLSTLLLHGDKQEVERAMRLRKKISGGGHLRWLCATLYQHLCERNNCYFPLQAQVPEDTVFPHGLSGIHFSMGAVVGHGCTILHHVTIGSNTLTDSPGFGAPVIGDNVFIGTGAAIIGGVRVGNNVRIGANAVVVRDVPDNATVVAAPSRIILHDEPRDNCFVSYTESTSK